MDCTVVFSSCNLLDTRINDGVKKSATRKCVYRVGVGLVYWLMLLLENFPSKITEAGTPMAAATVETTRGESVAEAHMAVLWMLETHCDR